MSHDPIESATNRYYKEQSDFENLQDAAEKEADEMKVAEVIEYINDRPKLSDRVWRVTQAAYRGAGIDNHIDDLLEELYAHNQETFFDNLLIWDKVRAEVIEYITDEKIKESEGRYL